MSIVIKKKKQYNRKKLIQRIVALVIIYFTSFISLYIFSNLTKEEPESFDNVIKVHYANDGERFLAENKNSEAVEYFLKKVHENPDDYISTTNLGIAYKKLNQMDKAKFYLYKSHELDPNYPLTYIHAADVYIIENDFTTAENIIDLIPTKTKENFLDKANLLVKLAESVDSIGDKIIHYSRALSYYEKYDKNLHTVKSSKLIDLYFLLADKYVEKQDVNSAMTLYSKVLKYRDDAKTRNMLALKYKNISPDLSVRNMSVAVSKATTQDEKRLTKENIITLKQFFTNKNDEQHSRMMNELLDILDESTILVDEKYTTYSIVNDDVELIKKKKIFYPQVTFAVLNKANKTSRLLYAKTDLYIHSKKIIDSDKFLIVNSAKLLSPNSATNKRVVKFDTPINEYKKDKYTIALSLSEDNKNWKLYRLYKLP